MSQKYITRYASSSEYEQDFDNLDFPNTSLFFSPTTNGYINADSDALALVAEKQAMGWSIAL